MLIILLSVSFCLGLHFLPEVPALLARMETDAAILSVTVFILIIFRLWHTAREAS